MLDSGRIATAQSAIDQAIGMERALRSRKDALSSDIRGLTTLTVLLDKTLAVFQNMSQTIQEQFLDSIQTLVSEGLTAVFGRTIKFTITPTIRGKNVNLDFGISADGVDSDDLVGSHGGGLVAVVGVILRLIILRLLKSEVRQILLLDEPIAHLSDEYVPACAELLKRLAAQLEIQVVMVTHQQEFAEYADSVIRLERDPGGATVAKA